MPSSPEVGVTYFWGFIRRKCVWRDYVCINTQISLSYTNLIIDLTLIPPVIWLTFSAAQGKIDLNTPVLMQSCTLCLDWINRHVSFHPHWQQINSETAFRTCKCWMLTLSYTVSFRTCPRVEFLGPGGVNMLPVNGASCDRNHSVLNWVCYSYNYSPCSTERAQDRDILGHLFMYCWHFE